MTEIVFAADQQYLGYLPCNLAQIARYGRRATGVTIVVPTGSSQEHLRAIRDTAVLHGLRLEVVETSIPSEMHQQGLFQDGLTLKHVSHFTFTKFLLPDLLPHLDDVLYLDVDTMVRAPLDALLTWKLSHPLGAVEEFINGVQIFESRRCSYFNAGVLRLSLAQLREQRLLSRATRALLEHPALPLLDQDVFNLLFQDGFDILPYSYNVYDWASERFPELFNATNASIVHFCGPQKPWLSSSNSEFSREWQRDYGDLAREVPRTAAQVDCTGTDAARAQEGSLILNIARRVMPTGAKRIAKTAGLKTLAEIEHRSMRLRRRLESGFRTPLELAIQRLPDYVATPGRDIGKDAPADCRLDLLISSARSGTNALGSTIERERPDVHYMHELYLGSRHGLGKDELMDQFPWFADRNLDFATGKGSVEQTEYAALMSENVVQLTRAVLSRRSGRTLIKLFPNQLHPYAIEALLTTFRPRLLILKRELIFSYASLLKASHAQSFVGTDTTGMPVELSERGALNYARACHAFFDRVALLAKNLGLTSVSLTYNNLFSTGADVAKLSEFYPGQAWPVDPKTGGLAATLSIQDRRTDASTLALIKSVCTLSPEAQAHMMRLPGFLPF